MFVSLNQVVYNERERERSGNESKTMGIVRKFLQVASVEVST